MWCANGHSQVAGLQCGRRCDLKPAGSLMHKAGHDLVGQKETSVNPSGPPDSYVRKTNKQTKKTKPKNYINVQLRCGNNKVTVSRALQWPCAVQDPGWAHGSHWQPHAPAHRPFQGECRTGWMPSCPQPVWNAGNPWGQLSRSLTKFTGFIYNMSVRLITIATIPSKL